MADQKLSALTELAATPAVDDEVYIRDVSEAPADESKRITIANLLANAIAHIAATVVHGAVSAATASKIVIRDASARAKFAAPGASGDALIKGTRHTVAEMPAMTDEKYWVGTGGNVEERSVKLAGLTFTELLGDESHTVTDAATWEDYDLSGIIGAGAKAALIGLRNDHSSETYYLGARKNGTALDRKTTGGYAARPYKEVMMLTEVDANRVIDVYAGDTVYCSFCVLGYWS